MPRHHSRGYYSPGSGHPTSNPVTNVPEEPVEPKDEAEKPPETEQPESP